MSKVKMPVCGNSVLYFPKTAKDKKVMTCAVMPGTVIHCNKLNVTVAVLTGNDGFPIVYRPEVLHCTEVTKDGDAAISYWDWPAEEVVIDAPVLTEVVPEEVAAANPRALPDAEAIAEVSPEETVNEKTNPE